MAQTASLGEARLRTSLDPSGLRAGLQTARSEAEQASRGIAQRIDAAGARLQGFGRSMSLNVTAPIVAAGAAAVTSVVQLGRYADTILDASEATGIATDTLQEYRAVARAAQISSDAFERTALDVTRRLRDMGEEGGVAGRALERLGLDTETANLPLDDMNQLLPLLLNELRQVESTTERNSIAADIFGRSYERIAPVLGMTADEFERITQAARESGEVMDQETLRAAAAASREFDELRNELGLVWRQLSIELLPTFQTGADILRNTVVPAASDLIEHIQGLVSWFNDLDDTTQRVILAAVGLTAAAGPAALAIGTITRAVVALRAALAFLAGPAGLLLLAAGGIAALALQSAQAKTPLDELAESIADLRDRNAELAESFTITTEAQRQAAIDQARLHREQAAAEIRALQDRIESFRDLGLEPWEVPLDIIGPVKQQLHEAQIEFARASELIREFEDMEITPAGLPEMPEQFGDAGDAAGDFAAAAEDAIDRVATKVMGLSDAIDQLFREPEDWQGFLRRMGITEEQFDQMAEAGAAFAFPRPTPQPEPDIFVAPERALVAPVPEIDFTPPEEHFRQKRDEHNAEMEAIYREGLREQHQLLRQVEADMGMEFLGIRPMPVPAVEVADIDREEIFAQRRARHNHEIERIYRESLREQRALLRHVEAEMGLETFDFRAMPRPEPEIEVLPHFFRPGAGLTLGRIFEEDRPPIQIDFSDAESDLDEMLARQGVRFAETLAQGIAAGDVERALSRAIGQAANVGAQAITGAIEGPAGILAGGAVGILGTLVGALFTGGRASPEAARTEAAARAPRGAPAISLTATINQTNHLEVGIDRPETRVQLREMARDVTNEVLRQLGADEVLRQARGVA